MRYINADLRRMEIDHCDRGGPRDMEQDMAAQYFLPLSTYPDSSSGLIISNAVAFAGHYGASLHACALRVGIPHIPNAWSSLLLDTPKMIEHAETLSRDRAETLIAAATNLAASAKVELSSRTVKTTLPLLHETAATEARFFDLAILECVADVPDTRIVAEAVLFGSGRPAVIFPNKTLAGPIDHLVIAWDGSRAAARAVSDANPFIHKAKRVSVLSLTGEKPLPETTGAHLAEILVSSGVNASATVARFTSSSIGQSIQQTALELSADMLVMGGFGHSRLRDFVLGGATDGVLEKPLLPVLMSH